MARIARFGPAPASAYSTRVRTTYTHRLDTVFLNHYTIHRHETAEDFAKLHAEMIRVYEPVTPREELTVLRIAQKHWALQRIDTFEMAISKSIVNQTRQYHPEANGHAAIALKFLGENSSLEVHFFDRMRDYATTTRRALKGWTASMSDSTTTESEANHKAKQQRQDATLALAVSDSA